MCGHLTQANKPHYKPFKFNDNSEEMKGLKLDQKTNLEDENIITWHLESHEYEVDSRPLLENKRNGDAVRSLLEINGFMTRDDSIDGREHITQYTTTPSESGGTEERTDLYTNTHVMDSEMPELAVFLQESNYQVVRDICIDRVVPSQESCSVENCELDHNIISCFLNSYVDINSNFTKEAPDTVSSISNGLETLSENNGIKDAVEQSGSGNLMIKDKIHFDASVEVADDGSAKNVTERSTLVRGLDSDYFHSQLSNSTGNYQVPSKEAVLASSMLSSATEALHSNSYAVEAAYKSEVESISITHDCDSSLITFTSREGKSENADCQLPSKTENMSRLEEGMPESLAVSSQNSLRVHDHGDSSFSAVGLLSGPIAYSGRIPYSGSISLRSNSSTTSTRSFAFPVLPSEWNDSPVKMGEVDRRNLRKRKSWRMACLCCKF
uniref:18S pre-ribosomal assembly protein gar2-related n=1 Tax=Davidia involucrata TaxID=16924 RepID=A0A5B7C6T3_DAVIN